jgi:hypothetical protein
MKTVVEVLVITVLDSYKSFMQNTVRASFNSVFQPSCKSVVNWSPVLLRYRNEHVILTIYFRIVAFFFQPNF